jgi:hypothetical protein
MKHRPKLRTKKGWREWLKDMQMVKKIPIS